MHVVDRPVGPGVVLGGLDADVVEGFDAVDDGFAVLVRAEIGRQHVGAQPFVTAHRGGVAPGHHHLFFLPVFQLPVGGDLIVLGDQPDAPAAEHEDAVVDVVNPFFAVGLFAGRGNPHRAVGVKAPDVRAAIRRFPVVRGEHIGTHLHLAAHRTGVAAGQEDLLFLLPFDAVFGKNLDRCVCAAADHTEALGEDRAANGQGTQAQARRHDGGAQGGAPAAHGRAGGHCPGLPIPG